jgi:hypothetical protein
MLKEDRKVQEVHSEKLKGGMPLYFCFNLDTVGIGLDFSEQVNQPHANHGPIGILFYLPVNTNIDQF